MSLADALARSQAKHPTPHHDRIDWTGVNYRNPVNFPGSWHACDTCGRMAVYGTDYGNGRSEVYDWSRDEGSGLE